MSLLPLFAQRNSALPDVFGARPVGKQRLMTWQRFLVVALVGVAVASAALALAAVLDAPWLRFVAVAAIGVIVIAREGWMWRGSSGRELAWVAIAMLLLVGLGFAWQKLFG